MQRVDRPKYVQHLMMNSDWNDASTRLVNIIINQKGCVYICGDGNKMARDVQETIAELLGKALVGTSKSGQEYLEAMKSEGRFLMDIWTS